MEPHSPGPLDTPQRAFRLRWFLAFLWISAPLSRLRYLVLGILYSAGWLMGFGWLWAMADGGHSTRNEQLLAAFLWAASAWLLLAIYLRRARDAGIPRWLAAALLPWGPGVLLAPALLFLRRRRFTDVPGGHSPAPPLESWPKQG